MIELEAGHSNHSFYCPSQVGEGGWGKIAIQAALYNYYTIQYNTIQLLHNFYTRVGGGRQLYRRPYTITIQYNTNNYYTRVCGGRQLYRWPHTICPDHPTTTYSSPVFHLNITFVTLVFLQTKRRSIAPEGGADEEDEEEEADEEQRRKRRSRQIVANGEGME